MRTRRTQHIMVVAVSAAVVVAAAIWVSDRPKDPAKAAATSEMYLKAFDGFSGYQDPIDPVELSPLLPMVGEASLPPLGTPMPADQFEVVEKYLSLNAGSLALMHQAGGSRECRWPAEYRDTSGMPYHKLEDRFRQGLRLLCLEAACRAQKGEYDGAAQSVISALAMARNMSSIRGFLPRIMRETGESVALSALERALNLGPVPAARLAELADAVNEAEAAVHLPRSSVDAKDVQRVLGYWHAALRLAQTAIAVERYRAVEGGLPTALDELAQKYLAAIPLDPFAAKSPIKYRQTTQGYRVYSIGPDGIDQNGERSSGTREKGDLTFAVERKGERE